MNTVLTFIGSFEKFPETAYLGDACVVNGQAYVYNNTWEEIGMYCATESAIESDIVPIKNQTLILDSF